MALPESKYENFQIALFNYTEGKYTLTEKYFLGENNLDTTQLTEWVEFSWRQVIGREVRHIGNYPGSIEAAYVDALIYVKPTGNFTRSARIKDTLCSILERAYIDVFDYAGGNSTLSVGTIQGEGISSDYALGLENDINKHLVTFKFLFIRRFNRFVL